ncbi:MAG TPA: hypothetical protein PKZ95_10705 [Syntrophorhabdaceae bacterium]|nr:hypothetical protein [Syntrophorhabdaceae bacterium]
MDKQEMKKRYDGLKRLPERGWDLTWVDRVRTFEDFLNNGSKTAALHRSVQIVYSSTEAYERECRGLAPELHDLILEAFPLTAEEKASLEEWRSELDFI